MVDAVVSYVVRRLGDYLIQEAAFLRGVRREVESLKKDLEWMLCFIKDAEDKQFDNGLIRQWVTDIQEIAYDCEDVLDKFMLQFHEEGTARRRQGLFASIKKYYSWIVARTASHKEPNLYSIGKEIEALNKRLKEVFDRSRMYGLKAMDNKLEGDSKALGKLKQLRKTTSFALEKHVVGFEDDTSTLLAKLLEDDSRRFVISIWGTGGLGKTTLVRKLYHSSQVKSKFQRCAWVSVSRDYNIEDLLRRIIKSFNFTDMIDKLSEEELKRFLHNSLQGYSYLVVIDDVWETIAWESLRIAFPENNNGSRVIITTRNKFVAEFSDERTYVHKLRFLREDESWELFCEKTSGKANEDEGLWKLGKEMVQKCGGLPLAIVVLGGLLSTKRSQEWRFVRGHIWRDLSSGSTEIENLLALSFNDLPYQLKLCFLYLGHYPEDHEIQTWQLIRQWVAEGFIPQNEEIMEDVAYRYLNELINRSLIQTDKTRAGRVVTCRVHDLLRDLAMQMAKQLNLFHIYDEIKGSTLSSSKSSCRRQVIYSGAGAYSQILQRHNPLLRSLIIFNLRQRDILTMCTRFKLLRAINLSSVLFELIIPEEVGKLIHLKYLVLRYSEVKYVPESILNLVSLQTLDIISGSCPQMPTEICKLQELRHLSGNFSGQYLRVDNLTNLQTLKYIESETLSRTNLEKLVNLRELGIVYHDEEKVFNFNSIAQLKNLRSLLVHLLDNPFDSLQPLSHCQDLMYLSLCGRIEKLPGKMHTVLPNLEYLRLEFSYLVVIRCLY
ncbi:putative disease resistance RPP13-like protein 3 [Pistacia vera]|uniref:putative disease resistance RPP13-like protein 3 n=1 Tax=Pistacia vera TaxID=55513 RepID=UPI0012635887|nr:putative disease resistance RPP13-like protein 3 [Pistacia vera]